LGFKITSATFIKIKYIIYYFHASLHQGAEKSSVIAEGPLDVYEIIRLELEDTLEKNNSLIGLQGFKIRPLNLPGFFC
jgi:hypothetical protein